MKNNTPYNQEFFNNMAVKFDTHIKQSIPLFEMFQANVAANIERLFRDKKILDVCGSTGELGRKLLLNGWQGQYTCLDGSKEMQKAFDTVTPAGSKKSFGFAMAGFMGGWDDTFDGETYTVPPFLPSMPDYDVQEKPYDLAIEILGFQFFTPDRLEEIRTMKKLAKTCILFEKFSDQDDEVFGSNEVLKDQLYKSNFFTQSEIRAKRTNVLENMGDYCYDSREFSGILHREFAYVERIAKIGNFSGYLVSTDENMHKQWVANMRLNFNKFTDLKTF